MGFAGAESELSPEAFLQLAGHRWRWRLLSELARSDRMVHELTSRLGQPQNLVSYHLGKLRDGRLVSGRRSSADGRDTYYTVDLGRLGEHLAAAGAALHPGLRLAPPGHDHASPTATTRKVLFLCTGNSARSQMAEALVRDRSGGRVEAFSAGSRPKPLHPNAVRVMAERDIDLTGHEPKHLGVFADVQFDRVITLCDRVREVCPEFSGGPEEIHWSIPDPSTAGDDDVATYPAFRTTADELQTRIGFLLAAIGEHSHNPGGAT